jgi:hypothetical protein
MPVPSSRFRVWVSGFGRAEWLAHEAELKLGPTDYVARSIVGRVAINRDLVDAAKSIVPKPRNPEPQPPPLRSCKISIIFTCAEGSYPP